MMSEGLKPANETNEVRLKFLFNAWKIKLMEQNVTSYILSIDWTITVLILQYLNELFNFARRFNHVIIYLI